MAIFNSYVSHYQRVVVFVCLGLRVSPGESLHFPLDLGVVDFEGLLGLFKIEDREQTTNLGYVYPIGSMVLVYMLTFGVY